MELRHLRYFIAIAEERSFTGAAERLWIAQPGLSTQMRRLEAELGVQLFERHPRGIELTQAGELFLERARVAVSAADVALATGRDLEAGVIGSLRLGLAAEARWPLASELLLRFGRERPWSRAHRGRGLRRNAVARSPRWTPRRSRCANWSRVGRPQDPRARPRRSGWCSSAPVIRLRGSVPWMPRICKVNGSPSRDTAMVPSWTAASRTCSRTSVWRHSWCRARRAQRDTPRSPTTRPSLSPPRPTRSHLA